jgi:hypothetical protein
MPAVRPRAAGFNNLSTPDRMPAFFFCLRSMVRDMFDLERLLVPGCTELPECRCGKEMRFARTYSSPDKVETHIRVYECSECGHELRLTVWSAEATSCD